MFFILWKHTKIPITPMENFADNLFLLAKGAKKLLTPMGTPDNDHVAARRASLAKTSSFRFRSGYAFARLSDLKMSGASVLLPEADIDPFIEFPTYFRKVRYFSETTFLVESDAGFIGQGDPTNDGMAL